MASSTFAFGDLLRNFAFTYFPWTDWRRLISPTIVFGQANVHDAPVEQAVVDSVGSYGFQLNRILDAMLVVVRTLDVASMSEHDRRMIDRLIDLAEAADRAAKAAEGHGPAVESVVS